MNSTSVSISSTILTSFMLIANANAAVPSYNVQIGIAEEDFEGTSETFNQLTGAVRYSNGLSRHSVVNINADLFTRKSTDLSQNDSDGLLVEIIYSYIPKGGFSEPVYSVALRQEMEKSDNSLRDFSKTSIIIADTIRFDDVLTVTAGLEAISQTFDSSDKTALSLFPNTDLQINKDSITYFNFKYQDEDVDLNSAPAENLIASNSVSARNDISIHHESNLTTTNPSLPDTGSIITIGTNYSINSNNSVDLSYESTIYTLSDDNEVKGNIISLDYFYKF